LGTKTSDPEFPLQWIIFPAWEKSIQYLDMTRIALGVLLLLAAGQSYNFFSLKEDREIGSESARELEQSLSLVPNTTLAHRYINAIGRRVTQSPSLPSSLNYQFRIVNSKDINSVGFPGGAVYINRGLLEIASNDDEIAAMVAHEVSHVASRHGTAQLSRQLLAQAPIAIAAGVPASQVWRDEMTKLGIPLGMDAPFLRYSRDQELQAGLMSVRLLADARYDPNAVRTILEKISEAQTADASRAPAFVFNHPQSATLLPEISEGIEELASRALHARASAEFRNFRSALLRLNPPATKTSTDVDDPASGMLSMVFRHPMDYYQLSYPSGWQITRNPPDGAIIAPVDGVQTSRSGSDVTHGLMVDLFDISLPDRSLTLEQATNRLLAFLRQRNQPPADPRFVDLRVGTSWLRIVPGAQTQTLISDEPGLKTVMIGKPDASSEPEVAWVVTRLYYQTLFYMVFVAPEDEFPTYQPVFEQMIRSVRFR
jgi:beta-barrel assembly-enhancing protease